MCQSTSTMRRRIFDAFFSNFFSRDFLSLILTRHRENKKKIFNFSIYLENYLLLRDKTKKRFFDINENLHLKLLACNDLFNKNIIFFLFFLFFFFLFFSFFRFSSSFSFSFSLSSREDSNSARFSSEYDSRRRRAFFFWRKSENRSWCRSESVWKSESKRHKHFHRCFVSSIAQKRRFIKLVFVDKWSNWHLRFIAQYSRKSRWSWRNEKLIFESREYLRFSRIAFFFVASWIFSKRKLFELTSRDEHHSRRNQSRWAFEWKSCSSQHKKSNQSEINQSWKSDRQIYDKRTTKQAAFKIAQRLQIDRSTSKTHLRTDFIVKNLKQRWQHLRFFFLSKTIFSVFEKKRSNLIMLKEKEDFHTNDMMKNFKSFLKIVWKKK